MHDTDGTIHSIYEFGIFIARARLPARRGVAHVDELGNAARHKDGHRISHALYGGHTALGKVIVHKCVQLSIAVEAESRTAVDEHARLARIVFEEGNGVYAVLSPVERDVFGTRLFAAVGENQADLRLGCVSLSQFNDEHLDCLRIGSVDQSDAESLGIRIQLVKRQIDREAVCGKHL